MHEDPIKKSFQAQCSVTLSLRKNRFQCAKYKTINYTILKVEFLSENSISTLRAKRATFTFKVDKSSMKMPKKWSILASFWKPEHCVQTVLPDRSFLKRRNYQKKKKLSNHPKCRIWLFEFWHFSPSIVLWKLTCLVTLYGHKTSDFQILCDHDLL